MKDSNDSQMSNDELNRAAAKVQGWMIVASGDVAPNSTINGSGGALYFSVTTGKKIMSVKDYSPATSHSDSAELFLGMSGVQQVKVVKHLAPRNISDPRKWVARFTSLFIQDVLDPRKLTEACLAAMEG